MLFDDRYEDFEQFQKGLLDFKNCYANQKLDLINLETEYCDFDTLQFNQDKKVNLEIDDVAFDFLFHRENRNKLYVIMSGGIDENTKLPHFERWTYYSIFEGSTLVFDDPMLMKFKDKKLKVAWYYGREKSYLDYVAMIVKRAASELSIDEKDIIFYGSSQGGYASLYLTSMLQKSSCVSINPQINLKIQRNWINSKEFEQITGVNLMDEDVRNDLREMVALKNNGRIVLVENAMSLSDMSQVKSFCEYLKKDFSYGLNRLTDNILLFVYDALPFSDKGSPHGSQELRNLIGAVLGLLDIEIDAINRYKVLYQSVAMVWSELYKTYRDCQFWINETEKMKKSGFDSSIVHRIMDLQDFKYYVSKVNSISKMQTEAFERFKNIHMNQEIVLVATGPSLSQFKPMDGVVYCGVNKAFTYEAIKLSYLFMVDYNATKTYIEDAEEYPCEKFYGLVRDKWEVCIIPESIALKAKAHRFYLEGIRNPVHYTLDICNEPLGDSGSVIFSAMQFLLWTNPSKIYLVGCDCTLGRYFYNNNKNKNVEINKTIYDGWVCMKHFAELNYPDTEIISINPVGLKGLFKDVYQSEKNSNDMSQEMSLNE